MKFRLFAVLFAILACTSFTFAGSITSIQIADDGDGVIACGYGDGNHYYCFDDMLNVTPSGQADQEYELSISGNHAIWDTGHIEGQIDTEGDPKLTLFHDMENETPQTWIGYLAEVAMTQPFTIDNETVDNPGWTYAVTQPVQIGGEWIGNIAYTGGTPVANGQTLSFGYRMTFPGTAYFRESLTPVVPEPAMIAMLVCGLVIWVSCGGVPLENSACRQWLRSIRGRQNS